ncbi:MAG TPA: hypothetical protein VMH01_00685 [Puia sp.]|nr:hypothetical protein [Puia sp.]
MKKITLIIFLMTVSMLMINLLAKAQCDKSVAWHASKVEFLSPTGSLDKEDSEKVIIQTSNAHITIQHGNRDEDILKGDVSNLVCNWTTPFKEGKTSFKTLLEESSGDTKDAVVNIEGKEGKIVITITFESNQGRMIRLKIDSYEETK